MLIQHQGHQYLGHNISNKGVHMDKGKVQAITKWPQSRNLKQLSGILELTSYYRRFIKGYVSLVAPLTDLLKKDAFTWDAQVTSSQPMQHFLFQIVVFNRTDASGLCIGVVLSQGKHLISFFLRSCHLQCRTNQLICESFMRSRRYQLTFVNMCQASISLYKWSNKVSKCYLINDCIPWNNINDSTNFLVIILKSGISQGDNVAGNALFRCLFAAWTTT